MLLPRARWAEYFSSITLRQHRHDVRQDVKSAEEAVALLSQQMVEEQAEVVIAEGLAMAAQFKPIQ